MASQSIQDHSSENKEPKITVVSCAIGYLPFAELSKNLSLLTLRIPVGLICFENFFFFFLGFSCESTVTGYYLESRQLCRFRSF